VAALNDLSALGTNLTKSSPARARKTLGIYFLRGLPDPLSDEGSQAFDALKRRCAMVKELGRYVEAPTISRRFLVLELQIENCGGAGAFDP